MDGHLLFYLRGFKLEHTDKKDTLECVYAVVEVFDRLLTGLVITLLTDVSGCLQFVLVLKILFVYCQLKLFLRYSVVVERFTCWKHNSVLLPLLYTTTQTQTKNTCKE